MTENENPIAVANAAGCEREAADAEKPTNCVQRSITHCTHTLTILTGAA
jgi:hypothetical protein